MEQWKKLTEANYLISSWGRMKNAKNQRCMTPMVKRNGDYIWYCFRAGKGKILRRSVRILMEKYWPTKVKEMSFDVHWVNQVRRMNNNEPSRYTVGAVIGKKQIKDPWEDISHTFGCRSSYDAQFCPFI